MSDARNGGPEASFKDHPRPLETEREAAKVRVKAKRAARVAATPQVEAPAPYVGGLCPDVETAVDFQTELADPFGVER